MKIGERIKQRRQELKWSQRELASRMDYDHSTITRIETGKIDIPQSRVVQFSKVLGVSIAYLMGWDNEEQVEMQKKNDTLSDIILQLREDSELLDIVKTFAALDTEKRNIVKSVINAFSIADK